MNTEVEGCPDCGRDSLTLVTEDDGYSITQCAYAECGWWEPASDEYEVEE
jgi:hypothetical protein